MTTLEVLKRAREGTFGKSRRPGSIWAFIGAIGALGEACHFFLIGNIDASYWAIVAASWSALTWHSWTFDRAIAALEKEEDHDHK